MLLSKSVYLSMRCRAKDLYQCELYVLHKSSLKRIAGELALTSPWRGEDFLVQGLLTILAKGFKHLHDVRTFHFEYQFNNIDKFECSSLNGKILSCYDCNSIFEN